MSRDCTTALQPGQQQQNCLQKKKNWEKISRVYTWKCNCFGNSYELKCAPKKGIFKFYPGEPISVIYFKTGTLQM